MNDNILIRKSIAEDTEAVYALLKTIADLHKNGRPDVFGELTSKYTPEQVRERLSREDSGVLVAEYNSKVVGYVFCDIIKEGNGLTLYVDDLCVDSSVRRMGIGRKLLDAASTYGKSKQCRCLMLNVWEFNKSAVEFYEKYGLTTRSRHLEKNL